MFFILIIVIQHFYYKVLGEKITSIQQTSRMKHLFDKEVNGEYDLAFIASSINFNIGKKDTDKRDIAKMLDDNLDNCAVLDVSRGGNNLELYDEITKSILKRRTQPTKFVYEISMRTFARVYNEPTNARSLKDDEYIFKENIQTSFYKALKIFRYDFNLDSQQDFNQMPVFRGTDYLGTLDEFMKDDHPSNLTVSQKKFLINYMGRIDLKNSKLRELKQLMDYVMEEKLEVLFLLPPDNYRIGIEYFPKDFESELDANVEIIEGLLRESGVPYLNLVKALSSARFTHTPEYPNGHLDQHGRQFVANQISKKIGCFSSN